MMQLIKDFYYSMYVDSASQSSTSCTGSLDPDNSTSTIADCKEAAVNKIELLWSLTNALFIPGGMFGSFLGGWMADKFGRSVNGTQPCMI